MIIITDRRVGIFRSLWFSLQIEVLVYCPLTIRQRYLYEAIKRKIRIEDLLAGVSQSQAAAASSTATTSSLMNLVMQFRKVMERN